tara:strand:- start:284 stop:529 length:246 start_codon:yes stop_codon:yes gene_type:complete
MEVIQILKNNLPAKHFLRIALLNYYCYYTKKAEQARELKRPNALKSRVERALRYKQKLEKLDREMAVSQNEVCEIFKDGKK